MDPNKMGTSTRYFPNQGSSLAGFEVVAKFLSAGERIFARQHVNRLVTEALPRNVRQRPGLFRELFSPRVKTVQEDRFFAKKIATDEGNHPGMPTSIFAHINDQRTGI